MQDIHIADGYSAAGSLRYAIAMGKMRGEVFVLNDDLSIGPLQNPAERLVFLRTIILPPPPVEGETFEIDESDCVFSRWEALRLRCRVPGRIMLWISGSAADHVLLRMACHFLQGTRATLWYVPVPTFEGGYEAVAAHPPQALARFAPGARPLDAARVGILARAYTQIVAHPEPVRQCDANGVLHYRDIDCHDALLLDGCPPGWTRANRVIGTAMGRCEPRHVLCDSFFGARLRALIRAGRLESRTPLPDGWWDWRIEVRRPASAAGSDQPAR